MGMTANRPNLDVPAPLQPAFEHESFSHHMVRKKIMFPRYKELVRSIGGRNLLVRKSPSSIYRSHPAARRIGLSFRREVLLLKRIDTRRAEIIIQRYRIAFTLHKLNTARRRGMSQQRREQSNQAVGCCSGNRS